MNCSICDDVIFMGSEIKWKHSHHVYDHDYRFLCCNKCFNCFKNIKGTLTLAKKKEILLCRFNNKCVECSNKEKLEVHHKFPKYKGGKDQFKNLIILCEKCHKSKHKKL